MQATVEIERIELKDLGTRVLEKCMYFSRRGQGRRISSHNMRHMCQRQNYATIPSGELGKEPKYSVTPDSRFRVLGTGTRPATMVQRKPTFAPPCLLLLLLFFLFLFLFRHSHGFLKSCCCYCLSLSTATSKSGGGSVHAAAAASSRLLLRCVSAKLFGRFPVFVFSSFCRLDLHNVTCVA
jgi:hypothetical protein